MADGCVFCGGGPLSGEHLWPDWIRKMYPELDEQGLHWRGPRDSPNTWKENAFNRKVNVVCREHCNNGWMSTQVEGPASRVLGPMLKGKRVPLRPNSQATLARWAFKSVLMGAQTVSANDVVPESHYKEFYRVKNPPKTTVVWLGFRHPPPFESGDGVGTALFEGSIASMQSFSDDPEVRDWLNDSQTYSGTLGMGMVCFQVFGSTLDGVATDITPGDATVVDRIWPPSRRFTWPHSGYFDDLEVMRELFVPRR